MLRRSEVNEQTKRDHRETGTEVDKVLESVHVADAEPERDTGECRDEGVDVLNVARVLDIPGRERLPGGLATS